MPGLPAWPFPQRAPFSTEPPVSAGLLCPAVQSGTSPLDPSLYSVHFNGEDVLSGKVNVIKELKAYSMRR